MAAIVVDMALRRPKTATIVAQAPATIVNVMRRIVCGTAPKRAMEHFQQYVATVGIYLVASHQPFQCRQMPNARHITMPVAIQAFAPAGPATVAILRAAQAACGTIVDVQK